MADMDAQLRAYAIDASLFSSLPQVDKLREEAPGGVALATRGPSPNMEAAVMLHNIQRIIQVGHFV